MVEERPRPRYGEYATPQDQANAIAGSLPPVSPLLTPGQSPVAGHDAAAPPSTGSPVVTPAPKPPDGHRTARPAAQRGGRRWDRAVTVALLAYGLFGVIAGVARGSNIAVVIDQLYQLQNIGSYVATPAADTVGMAINIVNIVLYAITVLVTVRFLQAGRVAFYIPIIGGVLAAIIGAILIFVLMFNDPAFVAYITSRR